MRRLPPDRPSRKPRSRGERSASSGSRYRPGTDAAGVFSVARRRTSRESTYGPLPAPPRSGRGWREAPGAFAGRRRPRPESPPGRCRPRAAPRECAGAPGGGRAVRAGRRNRSSASGPRRRPARRERAPGPARGPSGLPARGPGRRGACASVRTVSTRRLTQGCPSRARRSTIWWPTRSEGATKIFSSSGCSAQTPASSAIRPAAGGGAAGFAGSSNGRKGCSRHRRPILTQDADKRGPFVSSRLRLDTGEPRLQRRPSAREHG